MEFLKNLEIGEIFQHEGEWYQLCGAPGFGGCSGCYFRKSNKAICEEVPCYTLSDASNSRIKPSIKKLEKIGEPYVKFGCPNQFYQRFTLPERFFKWNIEGVDFDFEPSWMSIGIEIREARNSTYEDISVKTQLFDIEKAKAGEPVFNRDGCKMEIINFNSKINSERYPIEAKISGHEDEYTYTYSTKGEFIIGRQSSADLVMTPKKVKVGYINLYRSKSNGQVYTKSGVVDSSPIQEKDFTIDCDEFLARVPVNWVE